MCTHCGFDASDMGPEKTEEVVETISRVCRSSCNRGPNRDCLQEELLLLRFHTLVKTEWESSQRVSVQHSL